jgi:hypothetical protein
MEVSGQVLSSVHLSRKSEQCPLVERLYHPQLFGRGVFMWQHIDVIVTHIKNWQLDFIHKKLWNKLHEFRLMYEYDTLLW